MINPCIKSSYIDPIHLKLQSVYLARKRKEYYRQWHAQNGSDRGKEIIGTHYTEIMACNSGASLNLHVTEHFHQSIHLLSVENPVQKVTCTSCRQKLLVVYIGFSLV
jgi:hypothetical protein